MRRPDVHHGIRSARRARSWSRRQLAEALGRSPLLVLRLEHPRLNRKVPLRDVIAACDVLGVHPADVLGWQPDRLATLRLTGHIAGG